MKNRSFFFLTCIGFSILVTFISCASAPTQEELNKVLYTPEEIQSDTKCLEKYAGKTLKEVIEMNNYSKGHNTRKTKRQDKKECRNQPH